MKLASHFYKAPVLIACSKNNSRNLTPIQRTCAHLARLESNIQRTVLKVFSTEEVGGCSNGLHYGMGGDIIEHLGQVMPSGDYPIVNHHNGAYGNFAFFKS